MRKMATFELVAGTRKNDNLICSGFAMESILKFGL